MATGRIRIAVPMLSDQKWTGGIIYQHNLLQALRNYAPQVEVYLLTQSNFDATVKNAEKYAWVVVPDYGSLIRFGNRAVRRLFGYDFLLQQALRTVPGGGVDIIFPGYFSAGGQTAILCWLPDFQHVRLPEMFTTAEVRERNTNVRRGIKQATLVVLSSQDAQRDFDKFAPNYRHKARVMNFVTYVPSEVYDTDSRIVVTQYKLPEKFFYLPNQFWKHKNHITVLEALKLLKDRGVKPFVVCTGNPSDYRNSTFFAHLMQKVSVWELHDQVVFLGLVPYEHVPLLIRQSICVINPSLFEGWSTTIEEAKSIGKRVLLSDLAVHREQNPVAAAYFNPYSAEDLADKLAAIWTEALPGPDLELEQKARDELPIRMQKYVDTFISIACEAIDLVRGKNEVPGTWTVAETR